ncbi:MAG: DUF3109 family protein [Bacteroidota bacterium]
MIEIQEISIDPAIPAIHFRCNTERCKGACCTLPGGKGAPLLNSEVAELQRAAPAATKYLNERHRDAIEEQGICEGGLGDFVTTCVDDEACVFVSFENGIARCSLEMAWLNGESDWRKPLSCHLFPLRIDRGLQEHLRYEHLDHCAPALEEGVAGKGVPLADFLREPLVRAYGEAWYAEFLEYCRSDHRNSTGGT